MHEEKIYRELTVKNFIQRNRTRGSGKDLGGIVVKKFLREKINNLFATSKRTKRETKIKENIDFEFRFVNQMEMQGEKI